MKRYKYLVLAVLLTLVGRTYADNLTVAEVELKAGESKEIAINLVNPTNKYTAFQFDLVLPDGVTIEKKNNGKPKASLNVDRIDDHTLTATDMGSNTYRFLAYSMSNAEFYGTSGALVKVTLKAEEGLGSGGKTATIKNQVFTMVSGDQSKWDDVSFTISIAAAVVPEITADNKTREYGEENPAFTYTTSAPLNGEPELTTRATKTSPIGEYDIIVGRGTIIGDYTATNGKLTITKAPLKISGGTYTMKQGDALPTFTASYSGFKNGETQDVLTKKPTLTTTATSSSAPGTYDVIVSGAEAQNYEITYEKGTLTISEADPVTVTAKSYTRAYGDANPTFEYEVSGATLVGVPEITCEATATSPVGTYPIVVKKGSVTNYNVTYVAGTLTITKAPLTIKAGTYTKKQGEKNPEFTLTYEGFKNNETKAVLTKQPTVSCNATESSTPGEYPVTVSGAEAQNYAITYVNGTLIVTEADAVVVTAKSYTRAYGDANPTFEYEVSGATLVGVPEITCEATAMSPVGTYPIVVKKGSVTNYNVTYVAGTLTITKAPLSIKAGTYTKKQGERNPEFTLTYEGFKNNETKAVLTKQPTVSCNATESSAPGEYPVIVSGAEAQNYAITYVNGTLIVESNSQVIDNVTYEVTENGVVVSDGSGSSGDVVIPTSVEVNGQNYPVTAVGENAFKGNTALTSVSIPDGVVKIGAGAFEGCSNLMTIVIGADVANIGDKAFANIGTSTNAPRRTKGEELLVKCYPLNVPTTASNAFEGSPISSGTLLVEDNSATAYKAATPWRQFGTIMGFNEAAGIKAVWGNEDGNAQIFSLDGKPLNELQKSVNIVRMGNGKVRKVVVK